MRLIRLSGSGFRNLEPFDVALDSQFVVWCGPNAHGKTNALEAVHWLTTLKPLRGTRPRDMIRWGGEQATVTGHVEADGGVRQYRVELGVSRRLLVDERPIADIGEYFEGLRCIAFQPSDAEIVSGEPARRRAWLDRAAFTAAPAHLGVARGYKRILEHKSALLRSRDIDAVQLDTLDDQLVRVGEELSRRRRAVLDELAPHAMQIHRSIAGEQASLELAYRSTTDLAERVARARPEELRRRQALVGPQTDELQITLDGQPARTFASRGQTRSVVLALKLAEMVAAQARGDLPLFLIDDVSSELDRERTGRVVGLLTDLGAQVLATTTDPGHLGALPVDATTWMTVDHGAVRPTASERWPGGPRRDN